MAYTTLSALKNGLPYNYSKGAEKKLTEDGWIDVAGTFNETGFLTQFVEGQGAFIDSYLSVAAVPPFAPSALLGEINKRLAAYEVELYLLSASQDRVISVSLYANYQWAMKMLDKIVAGDLWVISADGVAAENSGTVRLIESPTDGATLTVGTLEENILLGGSQTSTEIPE